MEFFVKLILKWRFLLIKAGLIYSLQARSSPCRLGIQPTSNWLSFPSFSGAATGASSQLTFRQIPLLLPKPKLPSLLAMEGGVDRVRESTTQEWKQSLSAVVSLRPAHTESSLSLFPAFPPLAKRSSFETKEGGGKEWERGRNIWVPWFGAVVMRGVWGECVPHQCLPPVCPLLLPHLGPFLVQPFGPLLFTWKSQFFSDRTSKWGCPGWRCIVHTCADNTSVLWEGGFNHYPLFV